MKGSKFFVLGLFLALIFTASNQGSTFKHITIDGSFGDWAGIAPAYEDPSDATAGTDLKTIYLANDEQYLYVRFTLYAPGDPFTSHNNVFIDADNDSSTGFAAAGRAIGSEMLIQSGSGYQEKNGGFNEGGINGLDWLAAPSGSASDFEFRISRNATYAMDGTPVFAGEAIAILLEAENAQFTLVDTAPDAEGQAYTFASPPSPATSNQILLSLTGSTWRVNDSGTDLDGGWNDPSYDDTQGGWKAGTGLFGTSNPGTYPVPVVTTLAGGTPTYYLRTHFDFTNDPASVILVASNYLSDGAVFYLNGVEAKRIRIPAGTVLFNTAATGGPATEGQAEIVGFDTGSLNVGDNVLAVELHQTAGDTANMVFGMSLLAATQFPVLITDTSAPPDRSVVAGQSTTFSTEFVGTAPLYFQWLKNGQPISNATNQSYTIAQVLAGDAGSYAVQISNPQSTNVTSRAAVLTVTGIPVTITDPNQPADQTVVEGQPFTLSVSAQGSAPISYQWYFKNNPIEGATNNTYGVTDAALVDAGDYYVIVANPVPSSATSRVAHLTVNRDTTAPVVSDISGSPNKVTITFSEPVTESSATNRANYSLSGLTISNITWSADSPNTVTLETSAQTLGTPYNLTIKNVADRFNNLIAANTVKSFTSRIVIDGSFDDWANVPIAYSDPQDTTESTDYKDVYIANDADYLYLRVTLHSPSELGIFYNNIFIDADNDPSTGYGFHGLGSEMLVQGGGGYQEKNGAFNEGDIQDLDWAQLPEGVGTDFEMRISRHAKYVTDGLPVFAETPGQSIAIVLESENTSFATRDTAPDTDTLVYQFNDSVVEAPGPLAIQRGSGTITISWTNGGVLQTRSSLTTGTWQDVPGADSSGYTVQTTGTEAYYRVRSP